MPWIRLAALGVLIYATSFKAPHIIFALSLPKPLEFVALSALFVGFLYMSHLVIFARVTITKKGVQFHFDFSKAMDDAADIIFEYVPLLPRSMWASIKSFFMFINEDAELGCLVLTFLLVIVSIFIASLPTLLTDPAWRVPRYIFLILLAGLMVRWVWCNRIPAWYRFPEDISWYPDIEREYAKKALGELTQLLTREETRLRELGIRTPETTRYSFRIHADPDRLRLWRPEDAPRYRAYSVSCVTMKVLVPERPPHAFFALEAGEVIDEPYETIHLPPSGYFLIGDAESIEAVEKHYREGGLPRVVAKYKGLWVSRDPYWLYNHLHSESGHSFDWSGSGTWRSVYREMSKLPAPEIIEGFSADELYQISRRIKFYLRFTDTRWRGNAFLHPFLSPKIQFELVLPEPAFSEELVTIKILPHKESQRKSTAQFFNSLRNAKKPIAFELIAEDEAAHFELVCAPEDKGLVERQVRMYFPSFVTLVQEAETSPSAPTKPFYLQELYPGFHDRFLNAVEKLSVDPYAHLLHAMTGTRVEESSRFQVLLSPLPESVLTAVIGAFQYDSDRRKQVEGIKKKLPAWQVLVKLYSTSEETLQRMSRDFLSTFETIEQKWVATTDELMEAEHIDRSMDEWGVLSTGELAGLAHFPGDDVECEGLEMVSGKSKLPPPSYTEEGLDRGRD